MADAPVHTIDQPAVSSVGGSPGLRPHLWRFVYRAIDNAVVVALVSAGLAAIGWLFGRARADGLVSAFERRFVVSGWPHHEYAWINLHLSRFLWRMRRHRAAGPRIAARPITVRRRLRVGCVGRFRGLLSFPKALFDRFPGEADLFLFDLPYDGVGADYLDSSSWSYTAIDAGDQVNAAARAINSAGIDVLVNANGKLDAYQLLDRIDTPCILNFCPGSDLLHHDRVAAHMNGQPQADYFFVDRRLFCGTTAAPFGPERIYPTRGYYDPRDIPFGIAAPWADRKPLILFHGSLYKLAHRDVLDCLLSLVAADSTVTFAIMGRDSRDALARITRAARDYGVSDRVHYEGAFFHTRSRAGDIPDIGWTKLLARLAEARVAPDPWPVGGASARFEAFAMGVPSVHMGVRTDPVSWGRSQPSVVEVPHMLVPGAVAWTAAEHRALCERCLHDEAFADAISLAQQRIAARLGDPSELWRQVFDCYREWLTATGIEHAHVDEVLTAIEARVAIDGKGQG